MKIIKKQVRDALAAGGMLLYGGKEMKGAYMMPTILTNVRPEMPAVAQEVFGPVVSLITVKDVNEAVNIINASRFGLQASVFTKDEGVFPKDDLQDSPAHELSHAHCSIN